MSEYLMVLVVLTTAMGEATNFSLGPQNLVIHANCTENCRYSSLIVVSLRSICICINFSFTCMDTCSNAETDKALSGGGTYLN
jgi:hypothetical protein